MLTADTGRTAFRYDHRASIMYFVALDNPAKSTLMWFRLFDDRDRYLAISAWLGERQDLWCEWRRIAERHGGEELSRHITEIADQGDFMERFVEPSLRVDSRDRRSMAILAQLETRYIVVLEHSFATPEHMDRFVRWLRIGDAAATAESLVLLGLLEGPSRLATELDRVAALRVGRGGDAPASAVLDS